MLTDSHHLQGVASNKLLAKLGSSSAKPDGMRALSNPQEAKLLLQSTPIQRLPGMGGKVRLRECHATRMLPSCLCNDHVLSRYKS